MDNAILASISYMIKDKLHDPTFCVSDMPELRMFVLNHNESVFLIIYDGYVALRTKSEMKFTRNRTPTGWFYRPDNKLKFYILDEKKRSYGTLIVGLGY